MNVRYRTVSARRLVGVTGVSARVPSSPAAASPSLRSSSPSCLQLLAATGRPSPRRCRAAWRGNSASIRSLSGWRQLHRTSAPVARLAGAAHQSARLQLVDHVRHVAGAGQHLAAQLALASAAPCAGSLPARRAGSGSGRPPPAGAPRAPAPPCRRAAASHRLAAPHGGASSIRAADAVSGSSSPAALEFSSTWRVTPPRMSWRSRECE